MADANSTERKSFSRGALLVLALAAPMATIALFRANPVIALAPLFVSHMLMLYATLAPNCQWWGPVLRSFATTDQEVWLTIDDGPSSAHTEKMLDLLETFDARATFFLIGRKVENRPHSVTEILARGHAIANHTFTHPSGTFWCCSRRTIATEIDRCAELLRSGPDRPAQFFRAPAGQKNPFVHPILARRGLALVGWTVRGLDTVRRDPAVVAARIARGLSPGAIVLLHEAQRTKRNPDFNLRCLELTLQNATERGYRFVIPTAGQLRTRAAGK